MRRLPIFAFAIVCLLGCASAAKPAPSPTALAGPAGNIAPAAVAELDQPLPLDKRLTLGKLDNGLTYYVLPHQKPEKRAQFWLAVNSCFGKRLVPLKPMCSTKCASPR